MPPTLANGKICYIEIPSIDPSERELDAESPTGFAARLNRAEECSSLDSNRVYWY